MAAEDSVLEAFNEIICRFEHRYVTLAKEPRASIIDAAERLAWTELDKRKEFLGRVSSRYLQKEYEEVTTEQERHTLPHQHSHTGQISQ